jgi:hypothetical protein
MPYIKQEERARLDKENEFKPIGQPRTAGELNFMFTIYAQQYFKQHGQNYQAINDIMGALEGAKLEFYRRVAAPYEDQKIKENGDVY